MNPTHKEDPHHKPWEPSKDIENKKKLEKEEKLDEGPITPAPLTAEQARAMQRQYQSSGPRNPDALRIKAQEFKDAILDNVKEGEDRTAAFKKIDEIVDLLRPPLEKEKLKEAEKAEKERVEKEKHEKEKLAKAEK